MDDTAVWSSQSQQRYLATLGADVTRQGAMNDRLTLRSWHALNRSRRAFARSRWAVAAACVLRDDAKIASLEEQF
jgi:hypothetical protein